MQHYEIEDVRNRPRLEIEPLRAEIVADGFLALLHLSNTDQSTQIENLKLQVTTNFPHSSRALEMLNARGIKRLSPANSLSFLIDSFHTILGRSPEAEIFVEAHYEFKAKTLKYKRSFCIGDYSGSSLVRSPTVKAIEAMTEKLGKVVDSLGSLKQLAELLERSTDGSGIRLSKRTISALKGHVELFDPSEFDYRGYQIVADLSMDDAVRFFRIFHTFGDRDFKRSEYLELPADLRARFEKVFRVDLE